MNIPLNNITSISISRNRIVFSSAKPRRKPQAGDVKIVRGKRYVRQQVLYTGIWGGYAVRHGRPVYEWVPEEQARESYRSGWIQPPRKSKKS